MKTLIFFLAAMRCLAATDDQIANAIYKLEGGKKAKAPYGILQCRQKDL